MGKSVIWFIFIIVVGALLGSFLGNFIGIIVPAGSWKDLFLTELSAGLDPTRLDLKIIDLTFGCLFKINLMSIIGIIVSALVFRKISKK